MVRECQWPKLTIASWIRNLWMSLKSGVIKDSSSQLVGITMFKVGCPTL